jgi:plasmid stabilization system protein ParE
MTYRVELTDRAARDLRLLFLAIHADESEAAAR